MRNVPESCCDGWMDRALGLVPRFGKGADRAVPLRAQVSALIKVRHEEAGAILGIEGEKLGEYC